MIPQSFNDNWQFFKDPAAARAAAMGGPQPPCITLPHDAMVHEPRTPDTPSGAQTGFYPGGQYIYQKRFFAPADWKGCTVALEFEGVYQTAQVYLNGTLAASSVNGYTNFYADLSTDLLYGAENRIKVLADNSAVPNSRWYSGSGLYRGVRLWVGGPIHLPAEGVQVTTLSADGDYALVEVAAAVKSSAVTPRTVQVCVSLGGETGRAPVTVFPGQSETVRQTLAIPAPKLWDC
ncbi:glycoside hydrolase family 2 protein, partial [bacterium]|nr:glycoside hydrolase family 2 protein [bacterium]